MELHDLHHASTAKTAPDLIRRTCVQDAHRKMAEVRRHCQTCQAATHRNRLPEGKLSPHPVPPRTFASVCTDIFAHTKWEMIFPNGQTSRVFDKYNCKNQDLNGCGGVGNNWYCLIFFRIPMYVFVGKH